MCDVLCPTASAMDSALNTLVTQLPEEDKPVLESSFQTSGDPVQGLAGKEAETLSAREELQLFAGQAIQSELSSPHLSSLLVLVLCSQ